MNNTVDCKECNGMPPLPPELATPEAQMATACLLMTAAMKTMDAENKELREHNAKLRELVRNLLRVIPRDVSGVVVGAHGEHPTYYSFADAMRELGVEVDG